MSTHESSPLLSPAVSAPNATRDHVAVDIFAQHHNGHKPPAYQSLDDDARSAMSSRTAADGITIRWSGVQQELTIKKMFKPLVQKEILKRVSGCAYAGETLAIMGPSGAGKTSLLNILAGRSPVNGGQVFVNGTAVDASILRQLSVYVMQDDILLSVFTPREAILFSACLRLAPTISHADKVKRTEKLLEQLGLVNCADTYVRNLSGGERKRTSIGVELVSDPRVLFLDEPTSGLDTTSSLAVMRIVSRLASVEGRTVITTIHQPSSEIFELFQRLILMANGRVAYEGEAKVGTSYFGTIGYALPEHYNPADHFIRVLSLMDEKDTRTNADIEKILDQWQQVQIDGPYKSHGSDEHNPSSINVAEEAFRLQPAVHASYFQQGYLLGVRTFKIYMRDPLRFIVSLAQTILIAALVSLVFMDAGDDLKSITDRTGFFFFATCSFVFVATVALVLSMPNERSVFMREQDNKMYSPTMYYFLKNLTEVPMMFFFPLLFTLLVYWTIGLNTFAPYKFIIFWLTIVLLNLNGQAAGMLIGVSVGDIIAAMTLVPIYIIPTLLFSGFFKDLNTVPGWLRWISVVSPFNWGLTMLIVNEFSDLPLHCGDAFPIPAACPPNLSGDVYLEYRGFEYSDLAEAAFMLAALTAAMHLCAIGSLHLALYYRRKAGVR